MCASCSDAPPPVSTILRSFPNPGSQPAVPRTPSGMAVNANRPDVDIIFDLASQFQRTKALFTGIELGLFDALSASALTAIELKKLLKLECSLRAWVDYLDWLVCLKLLDTAANSCPNSAKAYRNSKAAETYLTSSSSRNVLPFLAFVDKLTYPDWDRFPEFLRTGMELVPGTENAGRIDAAGLYKGFFSDMNGGRFFLASMHGYHGDQFEVFVEKFDFSRYGTLCDVGCGQGDLGLMVAESHAHMKVIQYDMPPVIEVAKETLKAKGSEAAGGRIEFREGDFWQAETLPEVDIITMGNILHNWNLEKKKSILKKAYKSLNPGGAMVIIEDFIEDNRKGGEPGLVMSLLQSMHMQGGFNFTIGELKEWTAAVGFERWDVIEKYSEIEKRNVPKAVVAYKTEDVGIWARLTSFGQFIQ